MGWGAMIGLGSGLQQVGGMLMENNKQKLADKLEKDKEARAEARADKVYARDQASFDHTAVEQNPEGVWMQVDYAKSGDKLDSRLAPANVITEMNTKQQADKVSLENAILNGKKTQAELDYLPEKQDLDRRDTESQIAYRKTQGLADITRANNSGSGKDSTTPGFYDAVDQLVKDSSDLQQQYTKAPEGGEATMTASEYRSVVEASVKAAAQRHLDARAVLRNALATYVKKTAPKE